MLKLILFIGFIYGFYRVRKYWKALTSSLNEHVSGNTAEGKIDDVMVKDPQCEVYFPKRNGIRMRVHDQEVYFCSAECRDKYIELNSNK